MAKKNYGIPDNILAEITERDKSCVYCRKNMIYPYDVQNRRDSATIEHLNSEPPFHWCHGLREDGIVMCCGSCNSSRGIKKLNEWFKSQYCIDRKINADTVAEPVKRYLQFSAESATDNSPGCNPGN